MRRIRAALALCLMPGLVGSPVHADEGRNVAASGDGPTMIVGATLIDGTGGPPIENSVIHVQDGQIRSIASGNFTASGESVAVIDARGKYIVPGIVDAHTHIDSVGGVALTPKQVEIVRDYYPRAFLYHGVTTVLNMSAHDLEGVLRKREQSNRSPKSLLPRIHTGASHFTAEGGWGGRHGGGTQSVGEIRERLQSYADNEIDLVKIIIEEGLGSEGVFPRIPEPHIAAVVQGSRTLDLPVFTHASDEDEYLQAISFGPRAMAHGLFTPQAAGSEVIRGLTENGIFVVPTIVLFEAFYSVRDNPAILQDPLLRQSVPDFILTAMHDRESVEASFDRVDQILKMDASEWARTAVRDLKANTRLFAEAGVPLAVGTDGGGAVVHSFQGWNTPREMEILAECCLSNMETIVAASRTAARIMDAEDEFGTLQPGRSADLLILNADPLADIRAMRDFDHLMLRGLLVDRSRLTYDAFMATRPQRAE
jgi:imidazolonepropionase-like amidohydrolase